MDYLKDVSLFAAVAERGSFTKAAQHLGIPVSSLSRRIATLETAIGAQLLNRSTRQVTLTDIGEVYLSRCRCILSAAESAHREVHGMVDAPQGTLRLTVDPEIGSRLISPVVADYRDRYPQMSVEIDLSPHRIDLVQANLDLAIRIGQMPDSALRTKRIAWLRSSPYAAPQYANERAKISHPRDLEEHDRIHLLHQGDSGSWQLERSDHKDRYEVASSSAVASANNMTMVLSLALLGVGVAVLDDMIAEPHVTNGRLVRLLEGWSLPPVPLSLVTPNRYLPARVREFIALLERRVTGTVGLAEQQ